MANSEKQEFAAGICTQCGASITLDPSLETGICPYCGTEYVTNRTIIHSTTTNNHFVHNSNDTITVQYGKKGLAQSFFDYADKRAERREKAAAEERELARIQQAQAKEKRKMFWKGVGLFFLWLFFFPIMIIVTVFKRMQEKKEAAFLADGEKKNKTTTPLPIGFIVVGAIVWLFILFSLLNPTGQNTQTEAGEAAPAVVVNQTTPTETEPEKWYDRDPVVINDAVFLVPTVTETTGPFQYEIPKEWGKQKTEGNEWTYYFPYADTSKTFFMIQTERGLNGLTADDLNNEKIFIKLVEGSAAALEQSEEIGNVQIALCRINGMRAALISADYSHEGLGALGKMYMALLTHEDYVLSFDALMADAEKNISMDDYMAALCSITITETS